MAFASRRTDALASLARGIERRSVRSDAVGEDASRSWAPRPGEVSPALARMHERLRGTIPVPSVQARALHVEAGDIDEPRPVHTQPARATTSVTDGDLIDAVNGGTAPIEHTEVPVGAPAHLVESLQRFVRLRGRSGETYVFSRVEPRHVALYRDGVFATAAQGASHAHVIADPAPITSNAISDDRIYVHLLSDTRADRAAIVADLS